MVMPLSVQSGEVKVRLSLCFLGCLQFIGGRGVIVTFSVILNIEVCLKK